MKQLNNLIFSILICFFSTNAFSFQCPTIFYGITLVHASPGSHWVLQDRRALDEGWYIVEDPIADNHPATTVNPNATLTVYLVSDNKGNLYPTCEYIIGDKSNLSKVRLALNKITGKPMSSHYRKMNDNSYYCRTLANRTDWCSNLDIWQRTIINRY